MTQTPKYFMVVHSMFENHLKEFIFRGTSLDKDVPRIFWDKDKNKDLEIIDTTNIQNMYFIVDNSGKLNERDIEREYCKRIFQHNSYLALQETDTKTQKISEFTFYVREVSSVSPAI